MSIIGSPILLSDGNNAGYALIMATYPVGSAITCSNGTTTLTGDTSGEYTFKVEQGGDWTLAITDGTNNASKIITITDGVIEDTEAGIYEIELSYLKIYGVSWDGTSTTNWTRTDDAASFTDPVPYVAGATSYGSPFDNCYPWSDMTIVEDTQAGTMVKIPKFWYKLTQNGTGMTIQIADKVVEGYSVCPACMDRGDGNGEHDYILVGRYHCDISTYKSITGVKPHVSASRGTFRNAIHNLGSNIYMIDFATRFTIWLLYLVEFANWNSQVTIGYGCGNNASTENMGYTDSMPYHTGTMKTSRNTYGASTQYRNIEGLWDNVIDYIDGCAYNTVGLIIILNPSQYSDPQWSFTPSVEVNVGKPTNGYPSVLSVQNISGAFPLFIPTTSNGTDATYTCDRWDYSNNCVAIAIGADAGQGVHKGLFYVTCLASSSGNAGIGSRPMKFPS